jgi:hypothetical protein
VGYAQGASQEPEVPLVLDRRRWLAEVLGLLEQDDSAGLLEAAARMRDGSWWTQIPEYAEPAPVSGEIEAK